MISSRVLPGVISLVTKALCAFQDPSESGEGEIVCNVLASGVLSQLWVCGVQLTLSLSFRHYNLILPPCCCQCASLTVFSTLTNQYHVKIPTPGTAAQVKVQLKVLPSTEDIPVIPPQCDVHFSVILSSTCAAFKLPALKAIELQDHNESRRFLLSQSVIFKALRWTFWHPRSCLCIYLQPMSELGDGARSAAAGSRFHGLLNPQSGLKMYVLLALL